MILYKYTRPHHVKSILGRGMLALPLVSQLNDPYESSIQSTIEFFRSLHQVPPLAYKPSIRIRNLNIPDAINPLWDEYRLKIEENERLPEYNTTLHRILETLESCRKEVGVISLTKNPLDVIMWAHYAKNSAGVCIGINVDHDFFLAFKSASHPTLHRLFATNRVSYKDVRPNYRQDEDVEAYIYDAFFNKFSDWDYEKEYRILRPLTEASEWNKDVALYRIPREAIVSVYLGLATGKEILDDVLQLTKDISCDIFSVKTKNNEYKLQETFLPRIYKR